MEQVGWQRVSTKRSNGKSEAPSTIGFVGVLTGQMVDNDTLIHTRLERYGELVPLLLLGEQEICHYYFDEAGTRAVFT
jgi:hypothetical protein